MYVEVEIDIVCEVCGESLNVKQENNRVLQAEPCSNCMKDVKEESYEEGYVYGVAEREN